MSRVEAEAHLATQPVLLRFSSSHASQFALSYLFPTPGALPQHSLVQLCGDGLYHVVVEDAVNGTIAVGSARYVMEPIGFDTLAALVRRQAETGGIVAMRDMPHPSKCALDKPVRSEYGGGDTAAAGAVGGGGGQPSQLSSTSSTMGATTSLSSATAASSPTSSSSPVVPSLPAGADQAAATKTGMLRKKGKEACSGKWQRRFVSLRDGVMKYYAGENVRVAFWGLGDGGSVSSSRRDVCYESLVVNSGGLLTHRPGCVIITFH